MLVEGTKLGTPTLRLLKWTRPSFQVSVRSQIPLNYSRNFPVRRETQNHILPSSPYNKNSLQTILAPQEVRERGVPGRSAGKPFRGGVRGARSHLPRRGWCRAGERQRGSTSKNLLVRWQPRLVLPGSASEQPGQQNRRRGDAVTSLFLSFILPCTKYLAFHIRVYKNQHFFCG